MTAMGFRYVSQLCWVKHRTGMGYYSRSQHEPLIIARRGNFPGPSQSDLESSVLFAPSRHHSEKPHGFYKRIDRMYPGVRKRELFGRSWCKGWEKTWGNQTPDAPNIDPAMIGEDGWIGDEVSS
jgi:N6-adenosine-specific RNA methylase IME4